MNAVPPPENESNRKIAVLFLHGRCGMSCRFCITDPRVSCMNWSQYLHALETLESGGFRQVVLGGGEPSEWPHGWWRAARTAKERGFHVQLGTNGVHLPTRFYRCPWVDRYVLPLDAMHPELHNLLRGTTNGFDHFGLIKNRLEILRRKGREVTVSTVVNALNRTEIPALGQWVRDYMVRGGRVHAWHLYRFIPAGRGGERYASTLSLTDTEYESAVVIGRQSAEGVRVFKRPDMRHSKTVDFFWQEGDSLCVGSETWTRPLPEMSREGKKHTA